MRLKTFLLATLIGTIGIHPAMAKVESDVSSSFQTAGNPLDLATSVTGKHVFVLNKGSVNIFSRDGKLEDTISVDPSLNRISVAGLDIANLEDKIFLSSETTGLVQEISFAFIVNIDTAGSPFMGMADAPIIISVFSDFQ